MSVIIANCSQSQIKRLSNLYRRGYTARQIAKMEKRGESTVRRYLRVYEKYGISAFPISERRSRQKHAVSR